MIRDTSHVSTGWKSSQPKADANIPGNVGSPMKGEVIELKVAIGDPVEKGQVVAIISAMKMEMAVQVNP
jgi:biotin carboxyl carrier protein